jgi:branched-chain amino acid transport system ATP-binding protein
MTLLTVENVTRTFSGLVAVNDVTMQVAPGELRAVIGPNGAGKTTFFNVITGFFPPSSGRITFEGTDITTLNPTQRIRRGITRTFQITEIFPELTARENLRIPVEMAEGQRLRAWKSRSASIVTERRIAELLEISGLAPNANRLVGELSNGDQRAIEIMMALALKPRLLLLDEPTAGMGDQETYNMTRLVRALHRDHKLAMILIEHDMRVVFNLADRITVLAEGAVLAEGTPKEIAENEAVQAAYLGGDA